MKRISKGFTLAELIISSAILLSMTVFASYLFVSGWRHFQYGSTEVDQLRMGRKIIHQISQDIMLADKIYPQDKDLITLAKTFYTDFALQTAIIGYRMEKTQDDLYNIYKVIYPLNYDPNNPPPPESILLFGERIKDYNLSFSEKLYNINFVLVSRNIYQPDVNLGTKIMRRK